MKLAEATGLAQLRDDGLSRQRVSKEIKPALELARDIFAEAEDREQPFLYHTPESWVRKWLPSKRFRLMRVALNAVAMPCEPKVDNLVLKKIHAMETKPIIVDYNKNQVGKSFHGFVPQVIVIDGKHRFKAASLRGQTHIMAWVGEEAIREIQALGGGGPAPEATTPAPGARLNAKGSMQDASLQVRQGTTYAEGKKLKTLNVKKLWSKCCAAMAAGWLPGGMQAEAVELEAKSPPGWEGTVKKLKGHPEISNPYALAWWMNEQGYTPGGSKGGK